MDQISRRRCLLAIAGTLSIGGCLDAGRETTPSTDPTPESTGSPSAAPTATPELTPTATSEPTPTADSKRHDTLFIENVDQEEYTVGVKMTEKSAQTDEPIITGTYSVPGRTGIVFDSVGIEGTTYAVSIDFEQSGWEEHSWEVGTCSKESHPAGGNRNARIIIEDASHRFVVPGCDVHGRYEFAYVQPADVEVDE